MNVVNVQPKLLTVEDLMAMGEDAHIEIIDGKVIEMTPVGALHHFVGGNIYRILDAYVIKQQSGQVFMDGVLFLLHKKGSGIKGARVPDVSFVRKENFPKDWNIEEPIPGAPNLAVEIMSPNDSAVETLKRVRDYLRAGTEQVWVVYPSQKEVHQYRRNESPETALLYTGGDAIDTGSLFPGLEITTSAFFVLPEWFNKK